MKTLKSENPPQNMCNCRDQNSCPVENQCKSTDVIYQASVKRLDTGTTETYIGLTSHPFKQRWNNHKVSFNLESHKNETKLSTHIWNLKSQGVQYELGWRIVAKTNSYSPARKKCWLCIKEKHQIIFKPTTASLNMRNEFFSQCPHKNKFKMIKQG